MCIRNLETIFITGSCNYAEVKTWVGRGKLVSDQLKIRKVDHTYGTGGEELGDSMSTVSVCRKDEPILAEVLAMPELRFSVEPCGDVGGYLFEVCDSTGRNTGIYFDKKNLAHAEKLCAALNEASPYIQL